MKNLITTIASTVYPINEKGELKQNARNDLKAQIMNGFAEYVAELGLEVNRVSDGVSLSFPNETEGRIVVVFDGVIKSLQYDLEGEAEAFTAKIAEKEAKAKALAEAKAKKIAEKKTTK